MAVHRAVRQGCGAIGGRSPRGTAAEGRKGAHLDHSDVADHRLQLQVRRRAAGRQVVRDQGAAGQRRRHGGQARVERGVADLGEGGGGTGVEASENRGVGLGWLGPV